MSVEAAIAEALEDAMPLHAGASRTTSDPNSLSKRESEVLRLRSLGKDNTEIAEELVLSGRTVERHISSIFAKIGAQGKAARATWVAYALSGTRARL